MPPISRQLLHGGRVREGNKMWNVRNFAKLICLSMLLLLLHNSRYKTLQINFYGHKKSYLSWYNSYVYKVNLKTLIYAIQTWCNHFLRRINAYFPYERLHWKGITKLASSIQFVYTNLMRWNHRISLSDFCQETFNIGNFFSNRRFFSK